MEYKREKMISIHCDSISEMLEWENTHSNPNYSYFELIMRKMDSTWYGPTTKSTKASLDAALTGDNKLYNEYLFPKIDELAKMTSLPEFENVNTVPVVKRRKVRKDFGDELDIHAVNQGKLDRAWTGTQRIEFDQEHHLVTILIDIGGNSIIWANDTLWVAAACLTVIQELERAGKNVQIIVGGSVIHGTTSGKTVSSTACVKRYDESLNVERLAAMSHIGFFRSYCFLGFLSCTEKITNTIGRHIEIAKALPIPLEDEIKEGKTKLIVLQEALSKHDAIRSIKNAYEQMANK